MLSLLFCARAEKFNGHIVRLLHGLTKRLLRFPIKVLQLLSVFRRSLILNVNQAANLIIKQYIEYLNLHDSFLVCITSVHIDFAYVERLRKGLTSLLFR